MKKKRTRGDYFTLKTLERGTSKKNTSNTEWRAGVKREACAGDTSEKKKQKEFQTDSSSFIGRVSRD